MAQVRKKWSQTSHKTFRKKLSCFICMNYLTDPVTISCGHSFSAVEEQRKKLLNQMRNLWDKVQENQNNLNEVNRIITSWMDLGEILTRNRNTSGKIIITDMLDITIYEESHEATNGLDVSCNAAVYHCCYYAHWGSQSFTSRKYYWELGANDPWDWASGVCKDPWLRKFGPLTGLKDVFLIFVREGDHCSLLTTSPSFLHYVEIRVGWFGVLLDCDDRSVSFLNVAKNSLIWKYPAGSFNFPIGLSSPFSHMIRRKSKPEQFVTQGTCLI
ncbi:tripartite motif-containing protein 43B-like [Nannospalax galili]|uniref:tripartite motif-containing protein 43B-like n=1 Tax=Nannospalax galili TaxID=1026970 RepID=UPI000819F3D5|nr:tripartite motif-containing protein 43B-like [Nannospalax galili]